CSIARMKRFFAWLAGFLGGLGAYRAFRRQPQQAAVPAAPPPAAPPTLEPDPAEALKAKLAGAPAADEPPAEGTGVATRRRSVHDRARSAIDEMKGPGGET